MTSTKRENPTTQQQEQPHAKRLKNTLPDEITQSLQNYRVVLNPADCDLAFNVEADGLTGHGFYEQGFAYCWSGARANIGITGGKYYFGCKIVSGQPVTIENTPSNQQHVSRVGISTGDDPVGNLGETKRSFGYGGTGKFSNDGQFVNYGESFGIGDTIVCLVNLESKPFASIEFSKNGKRLGIAKHFDAGPKGVGVSDSPAGKLAWQSALFPHVLLKNTVVEMQFCMEDGLDPEEGYKPWASAVKDGRAVLGPVFPDTTECEVLMMVGLPACGKTTWAEKWVKEHPEKRYILLGTNLALDKMKVPGLSRKFNYGERFDRLMDRATGIFNTLLSRASKISRNYIIDQTNVYKSARKRKLKPFAFFHKIAVVVFPRQEELKIRAEKRFKDMGKEVPPDAVNKMLANFDLPMSKDMHMTDEYFDEVIFTDLSRGEAQQHLEAMKRSLKLSSSGKSKTDHPSYARESCVNSDSRMSACPVPGPGYPYSGYSIPLPEHQTDGGSWMVRPEPALQPTPANVNTRYGPGYAGKLEPPAASFSHQGSLNPMPPRTYSSYRNPIPIDNLAQYGSYVHDPHGRHEAPYSYGTPGYGNNAEGPRSAYQPRHVSPYGTPNPTPEENYAADVQHPGNAPYYPPRYY